MKLLLLIVALLGVFAFSQSRSSAHCETCPVPEATPTPEPTPMFPPPWNCYYVIIDGVKREVCE